MFKGSSIEGVLGGGRDRAGPVYSREHLWYRQTGRDMNKECSWVNSENLWLAAGLRFQHGK